MTAYGAKPSSSKPDADRRSTQLDPLDFAFGESRLRVNRVDSRPLQAHPFKANDQTF